MTEQQKKKEFEEHYNKVIEKSNKVWDNASKELVEPEAIVDFTGKPLISVNTITLIQGKTGSHKSRLAAAIVSIIISDTSEVNLLGFSKASDKEFDVLYVDTERNGTYQLPLMLQQIAKETSLSIEELKAKLNILSLNGTTRNTRSKVLTKHINKVKSNKHLVVFIDIISDLLDDFNSIPNTMTLIDNLNNGIGTNGLSFVAILHENPGANDKARGHLGTELSNKASTTLQIAEVENELVRIRHLKSRNSKKYSELYLKFDEQANSLVVTNTPVNTENKSNKEFKFFQDKLNYNLNLWQKEVERKDLIDYLEKTTKWSERKIESYLKKAIEEKTLLHCNISDIDGVLHKKKAKTVSYKIVDADFEEEDVENEVIEEPIIQSV